MNTFLNKLHSRLGDFWWYSLLMFVALRCGDVINAVVGLWLVPKYVPQEELGAVLPLTQFASTFARPISILVLVFTKFVSQFRAKGEFGKIKSLLRWFVGFVLVAALLSIALAKITLPALFERIRITDGSLTLLIITTGIVGTVAPVFNNALQGLKKFKTITYINIFSAPVRLITMLIALPIRALSGYMVGQLTPQIYAIIASCFSIRKSIDNSFTSIPFWRDDLKPILKYTVLVTTWMGIGLITSMVLPTIIRQRLPSSDSAAWYLISRFAELATYAGNTLAFVMFPMASDNATHNKQSHSLLLKMSICSLCFGLSCTLILFFCGRFLFGLIPICHPYINYAHYLTFHALFLTFAQLWTNFTMFEAASNRFWFLTYSQPIAIIEALFYIAFSGYTFFDGILPSSIVSWMGSLQIASIKGIYLTCFAFISIRLVCASIDIYTQKLKATRHA